MRRVLFGVSVLLLTLEVLQTKLFAFSLDPSLFYVAIGVALLGFGSGGTLLALYHLARPGSEKEPERLVPGCLIGLGISIFVAHAVFARTSDRLGVALALDATTGWTLVTLLAPAVGHELNAEFGQRVQDGDDARDAVGVVECTNDSN